MLPNFTSGVIYSRQPGREAGSRWATPRDGKSPGGEGHVPLIGRFNRRRGRQCATVEPFAGSDAERLAEKRELSEGAHMRTDEEALELSLDLPCGSSSHPVSMTLTWWGTVTMSSPCLLLPESARRLAESTCPQAWDEVKRCVQQALYGTEVDLPTFFTGAIADQVGSFFDRWYGRAEERASAVLSEWRCTADEAGLRAALGSEVPVVRWAAAIAAGEAKLAALVPELVRASEDEDFGVQVAAVRALAEIADARAVPILCRWLGEEERLIPEIRIAIAHALGNIGDARAVEPLIKALGDQDEWVRGAAAEALVQIGAVAVEPLIEALRDQDAGVRRAAAEVLGRIGDARTVEPLIQALRDQDAGVRWAAAEALGWIGDARTVEPLIQALRDQDAGVRRAAAEVLGWIGDARAVEPLIQALRARDEWVRRAAVEALVRIGAAAVEPLIRALNSDRPVRELERSLPSRPGPQALNSDQSVREAVVKAIERIGSPALRALIGRRIVHPRYGRGVVKAIHREHPPYLVVEFENVTGERILDLRDDFLLE